MPRRCRVVWSVPTRGGGGQLQQRLLAGPGRPLPALRHHGRRVLRARCGQRQGRQARSPAASRSSARPWSATDRVYFATLGSRVYALQPDGDDLLDLGLRQGAPGLHRRPLERRRLGAAPRSGRVTLTRPVPLLARHRRWTAARWWSPPAARSSGWRTLGREAKVRRLHAPVHGHLRPEHRRRRDRLPAMALAGQRRPGRYPPARQGRAQRGPPPHAAKLLDFDWRSRRPSSAARRARTTSPAPRAARPAAC